MSWLLIKLSVSETQADRVAEALEACGAESVSIEAASGEERLQSGVEATPLWHENRISGVFPERTAADEVLVALRQALGADSLPPHQFDRIVDADWTRAWMSNYRPLQIAANLWITPSWCTPPDPNAVNVLLDPGLAFGTGTHATTALCLAWLSQQPLLGRTVIDFGCGSGILAIAALKLGAARAIGVDIDPQALAASRDNAARNGVSGRYSTCAPDALPPGETADVVVANILAPTLIALSPTMRACVWSHGVLALSGILSEQTDDVRDAYRAMFALEIHERDGWVLLAGPRRR